ncbi:hypothetical protein FUT69_02945 [Xylella taiwanensis]|uniref:Uncharacterized protein n=1 Tax=Xylella taiwanensis TaxID=1444770 RepID=Z9JHY5_9GAMM|nr:hypothetical protein [Xylella taiwanensis]AXI83919.1 hypothetical protein AB672_08235 [Xylella taiwanensis]EWS77431.1 hypothetical protein AF72_10815 [Xylella taiwanensis]MCD8457026.1 hypothetical protein [Xylella taiwanensis]MCD8459436.1 hypothetical protein [Xylella taiwanensis]MCD8461695.1 hypothetical protein [Xylella taiwanensis]
MLRSVADTFTGIESARKPSPLLALGDVDQGTLTASELIWQQVCVAQVVCLPDATTLFQAQGGGWWNRALQRVHGVERAAT